MANKVIGSTDASGAMSTAVKAPRSVLFIGSAKTDGKAEVGKIYTVYGTSDMISYFGESSPFVEMVRIMISNGVNFMKCINVGVVTEVDKGTKYGDALTASLSDKTVEGIVLDDFHTDILTKLKVHLDLAEDENMPRYCCVGGEVGVTNTALGTLASSINHKRVFTVGPNVVDDNNEEKHGIYTAAGLMSLIMTETDDPALPMNGVTIKGYHGVARVSLASEKDALVVAGVVCLYDYNDKPAVWRLVTSKTMDGETPDRIWQEGTTVFIADDVLDSVLSRIRLNYKRTKNVPRILDAIKTDVIDVLKIKNDLEIIHDFDKSTVTVIQDPDDLYGALVDYEFKVVTPLYTITVRQHMSL